MRIIETFLRGQQPKHKPTPVQIWAKRTVTRSQPNSRPCRVAKLRTLPPRSATSTPAPAAKSPYRSQPAISCLGAFRPPAVGVRGETIIPAAENLHTTGRSVGGAFDPARTLLKLRRSASGGYLPRRLNELADPGEKQLQDRGIIRLMIRDDKIKGRHFSLHWPGGY